MALDINEINKMYVVEWNARQKKFHIQTLGEILKSNLLAAVNGRTSGYVAVAIAHTEREALEIAKLIKAKLKRVRRTPQVDSSDTLH
ncbi:MAG TPA: hypothetical protein VLA93_07605 [Pyrinomonadaceae bacterium]|nr:hypothetical protein [Pyrinomonadaceae bacterium]